MLLSRDIASHSGISRKKNRTIQNHKASVDQGSIVIRLLGVQQGGGPETRNRKNVHTTSNGCSNVLSTILLVGKHMCSSKY